MTGVEEILHAKTWELADAYKQIPLSDHAFAKDAYLVYSPSSRGLEIYQQRVLPFGSVASVTAFLRVAPCNLEAWFPISQLDVDGIL